MANRENYWSKSLWNNELSNKNALAVGIFDKSNLIALISGYIVLNELNINFFVVDKAYRNIGYGKILLKYYLIESFKKGSYFATLEVNRNNIIAKKIYENFGFVEQRIRKNYYYDGSYCLVLSLDVRKFFKGKTISSDYPIAQIF